MVIGAIAPLGTVFFVIFRSYLGLTSLMQISTRTQDYIVDTLALWRDMWRMNEITADPNIVKVICRGWGGGLCGVCFPSGASQMTCADIARSGLSLVTELEIFAAENYVLL